MIAQEQQYRAAAYALLAALLRNTPDQALLDHTCSLSPQGDIKPDDLSESMQALANAAASSDPARLDDEYQHLFIGLGKGEVVPYGSWYLTGFLMEQPLADLRRDLTMLGFERNPEVSEPEDHIAAIFEIFSVMISDTFDLSEQRRFFETHMQPWIGRFFTDLAKANSASFYQAVAGFGNAFFELERDYFSMRS